MRRVGANAHIADGSSGAGSARPQLGFKQRLLHCNRLNHIEKPLFMSITSGVFGCKYLCAAKPLFRQGKGMGGFRKVIKSLGPARAIQQRWKARTVRRSLKAGEGL